MPNNPQPLSIQAHASFRGADFSARAEIIEEPIQPRELIRLAATGRDSQIVSELGWRVSVPMLGDMSELFALLDFYQLSRFGQCVGPHAMRVTALDTATDRATIPSTTGLTTAEAVYVSWTEVAPTLTSGSLSRSTTYYARVISAGIVTLHPTANDATNNTNAINFSADAASGAWFISRAFPLVVWRSTGVKRTYKNAIVEKFPQLVLNGGKLRFSGSLVFRCLPDVHSTPNATSATDFYTEANSAYTPPDFSPVTLTEEVAEFVWGGSAPWSSFRCEDGMTVDFEPEWEAISDGCYPAATMRLKDFKVSAKGRPIGITKPELDAALAGNLGAMITGSDLVITLRNGGYILTLLEAFAQPASTTFSASASMVPVLTWMATGGGGTDMAPPFTIVGD